MATIFTIDQLPTIVKTILIPRLETCRILTFTGPLGAGKTTLIKELLKQCDVTQVITSPTFGYVNTYQGSNNRTFHHFDLYRIASVDDFIHAGFAEYFHQPKTWVLIEWPESIQAFLDTSGEKSKICSIKLSYDPVDITKRMISSTS